MKWSLGAFRAFIRETGLCYKRVLLHDKFYSWELSFVELKITVMQWGTFPYHVFQICNFPVSEISK